MLIITQKETKTQTIKIHKQQQNNNEKYKQHTNKNTNIHTFIRIILFFNKKSPPNSLLASSKYVTVDKDPI